MDFDKVRKAIKDCLLFEGLTDSQLGLLMMTLEIQEFPERKVIYAKGQEAGTTFLLLVEGQVAVVGDDRRILDTLGPGQLIGEIGALSPKQRRTATIASIKPTHALRWDIQEIKEPLPELMARLKDLAWKRATNW